MFGRVILRVEPTVKGAVRNPETQKDELWFICVRTQQPFERFDAKGAGPVHGVDGWSAEKIIEKAKKSK